MYDLYFWPTPNGLKISIFFEETGLPYQLLPIDIRRGDQFRPEFLAISPNNKVPALVDKHPSDGGKPISVFESGAILLYLADKIKKFIPQHIRGRNEVIQWLFWQMAGLGPMAGQNHHFTQYASEKIPYAIERYVNETGRLYRVLNQQLANREYITDHFSIVDMACYPWINLHERQQQSLSHFPNLHRWYETLKRREGIIRAYQKADDFKKQYHVESQITDGAKKISFGQK